MIDVFPDLINEDIFKYFEYQDYLNLSNVLDDICADHLRKYMANPEADSEIVDYLNNYCGEKIRALTLHLDLRERGINDMIAQLSPDAVLQGKFDIDTIIENLDFILEHENSILVTLPKRSTEDFNKWMGSLTRAQAKAQEQGVRLAHPEMLRKIKQNKYIFHTPNNVSTPTGAKIFRTRKRQWMTCLRGAQFIKQCDEMGLSKLDRRTF